MPDIYQDESVTVRDADEDHVEVVIRMRKTLWDDLNRRARAEGVKIALFCNALSKYKVFIGAQDSSPSAYQYPSLFNTAIRYGTETSRLLISSASS